MVITKSQRRRQQKEDLCNSKTEKQKTAKESARLEGANAGDKGDGKRGQKNRVLERRRKSADDDKQWR